jgi:hypothetical protein
MVERDLPLRLSEYCDCDQYTRWICLPCKVAEDKEDRNYYKTRTELEYYDEPGLNLTDHQHSRAVNAPSSCACGFAPYFNEVYNLANQDLKFWCPCGTRAPRDGNVRCAWCKRRHNLDAWMTERSWEIPFFDQVSNGLGIIHNGF